MQSTDEGFDTGSSLSFGDDAGAWLGAAHSAESVEMVHDCRHGSLRACCTAICFSVIEVAGKHLRLPFPSSPEIPRDPIGKRIE